MGSSIDAIRFKLLSFNENGNWGANYLENGKLARSVGCTNGEITAIEYVSTGANLYFSKQPDGSYWFSEVIDNIVVKTRAMSSEGWYSFSEYENGIMVGSYSQSTDGTVSCSTYDANGTMVRSRHESPDGTVSDATYDPNGMLISSYYQAQDGYITQQTYYPSGNISVSEEWSNGAHTVCTYAEDGSLLNYVQEPWDGTIPDNG